MLVGVARSLKLQNNNNGLYSLIRKQWETKSISGSIINLKNVQVSNDDEILLGWADYFKDLATPTSMPEFDKAFLQQAENDVKNLYNQRVEAVVIVLLQFHYFLTSIVSQLCFVLSLYRS
jgi:hypothetical protein